MGNRRMSLLAAGLFAAAGLVTAGPAMAFNPTPEPPAVVPLDGAHWMAGAGFPDASRRPDIGMVQTGPTTADTHVQVARIQHLPGDVTELGFASQVPNGINPCWMVGITNPDGSTRTLRLTTDSAQVVSDGAPTWRFRTPHPVDMDDLAARRSGRDFGDSRGDDWSDSTGHGRSGGV